MAVDGNWNLVLSTPMGDRNSVLSVTSAGGALTGTLADDKNSGEIFDGTVSGNDVAWKLTVTEPIQFTLKFKGTVAGAMGHYPFTGKRA